MRVSAEEFERIALAEPGRAWELHRGRLREKPAMVFRHNDSTFLTGMFIGRQIDLTRYRVRVNAGHVRRTLENYYTPDVAVIPIELALEFIDSDETLEVYEAPLPLVVEVWSRSTGRHDLADKLPEYMKRGDHEIWRFHPFTRTIQA
jgi:Uma2 family endonuclease